MLKGEWKLLICILVVACIGIFASNGLFAEINDQYLAESTVTDANLEDKIGNSLLLDAIGSLIYAVGSLMEWVIGKLFQVITQSSMFPWADAILFNAVPFLDVNIFTAAQGSLISQIYDFITGMYYSLLMLASTFFGIAVMVSAIKLVLTAIAEDKAKYKKAIVDWLLGLVMLWGIHFFMSFVLYLNEQLVVMASSIAKTQVDSAGQEIVALADTSSNNAKVVGNFISLMDNGGITLGDVIGTILDVAGRIILTAAILIAVFATAGIGTIVAMFVGAGLIIAGNMINFDQLADKAKDLLEMSKSFEDQKATQAKNMADNDKGWYDTMKEWMFTNSNTYTSTTGQVSCDYSPIDLCAGFLKNSTYTNYRFKDLAEDGSFWTFKRSGSKLEVARLFFDASALVNPIELNDGEWVDAYVYYKIQLAVFDNIPLAERITTGDNQNYDADLYNLYTAYCNIFEQYVLKQKSEVNIINNLAEYFKETAWETSETGWKANKSVIQNAIMYVLLVSYSLVFFISYTKRLFYVIMLILMAPIVVVFDFFVKFGK